MCLKADSATLPGSCTCESHLPLRPELRPPPRRDDLRHACASLLLAQELDLKVIQEVLGHSTITTTGDLYAQVLMGLKRQAADRMDALLGPERQGRPRPHRSPGKGRGSEYGPDL
jgi:integrase-like protein